MTDDEFIRALEDCSLPGPEFTHEAHVRAAYLYLRGGSLATGIERTSTAIRRYAASLGVPDKYHETITVAFVAVIHERLADRGDGGSWSGFAAANPELFQRDLLLRWYPAEQLGSPLARRAFLLPRVSGTPAQDSV